MKNLEIKSIVELLESLHAQSIVTLHTAPKTIICDYMILATVNSYRQMRFIGNELHNHLGGKRQHQEGSEEEWVLVDLGNVIIHLMTADARVAIDLESLWSDKK